MFSPESSGRHWRDLRLGWCVDHGIHSDLEPTARMAWHALAAASRAGERLVTTAELAGLLQHETRDLDDVLDELFTRRRARGTPIVRLGRTGQRRWAAYARAGRVDQPLETCVRTAVLGTLGGHAPGRTDIIRGGPDTWWRYGGWLRFAFAAVAAREAPPTFLDRQL